MKGNEREGRGGEGEGEEMEWNEMKCMVVQSVELPGEGERGKSG